MGAHEHVRRSTRHETEEDTEVYIDSVRDNDEWVADDKRKTHSRKSGSGEDVGGLNYDGRKRKHESRKRSGGSSSSRADSDQDDHESRKQAKQKSEENTLDVLSTWYQDEETENKPGNRGHSRGEESDRKKSSSKYSERHGADVENMLNRGKGSVGMDNRSRWEEPDNTGTHGDWGEKSDVGSGKPLDPKSDSAGERERDGKEKSHEKEGRHFDSDRINRERSEIVVDDRSKGRDDSWADRSRDRDTLKDYRKRKQDIETRDGETNYDSTRDWKFQRRGCEWIDGHSIGKRDGSRTEAVKTKYGISSENYDVIEIQPKPFDYVKENSRTISASNGEVFQQSDTQESGQSGEEVKDDQHPWRDDNNDIQIERPRGQKSIAPSGASLPPLGNNRMGRVGRGRQPGRDSPMPLGGSTFGPLGLPPLGSLQSLPPNMTPTLGPISPGVFIPNMNMLGVPSVFPPGPLGPRFSPNLGNAPSGALVFNPSGLGRGIPPSMSGPSFNTMGRGQLQEKGWIPPRSNVPFGKAPSRGEQNDYSQNFVDTGMRPQNFIREWELTSAVEDYPRLRELIQKKDEIVANSSFPPMYYKCDLKEQVLSPEFFGTKFDVILVDPPWEEYVHRAPGITDQMSYWTFEEIMNLKIEAIADTPSFIFLWVGDGVGLEQGRQCLKKWGFRRCEDICWVKTNKSNATPGLRHDSHTLFQRSKEHCLMGIKGTVRRSTDGHIIHANIDTDVIIAEEPPYGSTAKPEDMHRIVEHFALGRRRLELFGEDHNIRSGWLTVGNGLSSSNFNSEAYIKNFADKDGKMWLGGSGRNPPPEAPHLVLTTPDIESLRPKSPMKNQQQMQQQQSATISLITPSSSNKRLENLAQNYNGNNMNLEASASSMPSPAPWASSMEAFLPPGYGYNAPFGPGGGESQRGMSM